MPTKFCPQTDFTMKILILSSEEVGQGVTWHAVILQNCVHLRFDLRRGNIDPRTDHISNWYNMDALEVQSCQAAVFEEESAVYWSLYYCDKFTVFKAIHAVFVHISFLNSPSVTNNTLLHAWFLFKCSIVCPLQCFIVSCSIVCSKSVLEDLKT